ncbi:MAG: hypothetical protein FE78DRAFT_129597, partial [Acidomyces sp. 'richmondensis']
GKKRKASGVPGSRGVANLTPEQLAKKRANDREAQRAIRERTRNTIESLERRIRELESQQPFQELQRVMVERDRAIAECEELRNKLSSITQIIGSQHGSIPGTYGLAALTAQQSPLPPLTQPQQAQQHSLYYTSQSGTPGGSAPPQQDTHLHPDLRSPSFARSGSGAPAAAHTYATDESSMKRWSPTAERSSNLQHAVQPNVSTFEQQRSPQTQAPQTNGERPGQMGLNYVLDSTQQHTTNSPPEASTHTTPSSPTYARLPRNTMPATPLDSLLGDFIARCREQLATGSSMQEVLGPNYPSFAVLHDPDGPQRHTCHPVSALLIDILSKFPDISELPEKVAVLYIMFLFMRWCICPCEACYARLPEWVRPVPEQLEMAHARWIDNLPWPFMRKQLVNMAGTNMAVNFDDFFVPYTTTLSLNWPYPKEKVLISNNANNGDDQQMLDVGINPVFEVHLRELTNWSLGTKFKAAFPDLVQNVRLV